MLSVTDLGFAHKGGNLYMVYQRQKERFAAMSADGTLNALGLRRHPMTDPMDLILRPDRSRRRTRCPRPAATAAARRRRSTRPTAARRSTCGGASCRRPAGSRRASSIAWCRAIAWTISSAHYLGDPLLFWRIADANNAMRAETLVARQGRLLRIAFPESTIGSLL